MTIISAETKTISPQVLVSVRLCCGRRYRQTYWQARGGSNPYTLKFSEVDAQEASANRACRRVHSVIQGARLL
jgi:hypothetical protein